MNEKKTILKCYWSGFLFCYLRNFLCVCLLVLLMLDCLLCIGSDGDSVCLLGLCRISIPRPAPAPGGLCVCWGRAKTWVGKPEKMAAKALAFHRGGKGVSVPSSSAADPHHGDELRNVGLLGVRSGWQWR